MISYAQNLEDVVLNRIFQGKRQGFFVDVGAHDPTDLSVTRYFYDLGWTGINIEPIPRSFEKFVANRPRDINLNIALGVRYDILSLYEVEGRPDLSTFSAEIAESSSKLVNAGTKTHMVEVRTLRDVCNTYCKGRFIDFIKIDVEGFEKEVILGGDWSNFRPSVLLVESTAPTRAIIRDWDHPDKYASWPEWEQILLDADYVFGYYDGLNRLYVRREDEHLARRFHIPITVLQDNFCLYKDVRLAEESEILRQELAQQNAVLGQQNTALESALELERLRTLEAERRVAEVDLALRTQTLTSQALRSVLAEICGGNSVLVKYMRRMRKTPETAQQMLAPSHGEPTAEPRVQVPIPYPAQDAPFGNDELAAMFGDLRTVLESHGLSFVQEVLSPPEPIPSGKLWVGMSLTPNRLPEWAIRTRAYQPFGRPGDLSDVGDAARRTCRCLITFSQDHASLLAQSGVSVMTVKHPLPPVTRHWSPQAFAQNGNKALIQQGWWLMQIHGLHLLPKCPYRKIWIRHPSDQLAEVAAAERHALQKQYPLLDATLTAVEEVNQPSRQDVEQLLCSNIAFAHYLDASAPPFLLSCIAHHTPILLNPLPAVREYLGDDYPYFYYFYADAVQKAADEGRLHAAHEYLRQVAMNMSSAANQLAQAATHHIGTAA